MRKLLFVLIGFFILISCKKEETPKEKFDLEYKVRIYDVEEKLERVNFYTNTYFPDEDITAINGDGKSKNRDFYDERYLNFYDSITYTPELKAYTGCRTYFEITFHFVDSLNIEPYVAILQDTIIEKREQIIFSWPEDTLKLK